MKISFLGAAKTVTGSCYLVETGKTAFIIDCGLHQGHAEETILNRTPFPFEISKVNFMLLTHAHIDHSGRIPKLYVDGFRQPIYTTKATAELCAIMLPDSGHIQESEQAWQIRKNGRAGKTIEEPLYTMQDAIDACRLFKPGRYDTEIKPADDVRVIFRDAGHILGSAILEIWVMEDGKESKVVFSGDLGNKGIPILRDPAIIDGTDYLVIESTYGDRLHNNQIDKVERFVKIINETIARHGNVVIPSFAVGRTQEIIYELHREEDKYKDHRSSFMQVPVYVDSPLAVSATQVFRNNTDCFDEEARKYIENGDNPLDFPNLHFTTSTDESKALNISDESKVIISASGMCDAGRIKHHLKHNLWRQDSSVIFVGFQAPGTLGRHIVDGAKMVRIFGEEIAIKARIEMIEGFSGHADRDGLLEWINAMQKKPQQIMLVHGEPNVIASFEQTIQAKFGIATHIAELDETVVLGAPVTQPSCVQPRPLDLRIAAAAHSLEIIELDFLSAFEHLKSELKTATTPDVQTELLKHMKENLSHLAEEVVAKYPDEAVCP